MAKTYTYEWAVGDWNDRQNLTFKPVDQNVDTSPVLPAHLAGFRIPEDRVPCRMEDTGNGVYYLSYRSTSPCTILRITVAEA